MELSHKSKQSFSILHEIQNYFSVLTPSASIFSEEPMSAQSILHDLDNRLKIDNHYTSGKVLGAMSTPPHNFAKRVFSKYIDRNLGDRGLNPGTVKIEQEVISILGDLLHNSDVEGNLTSGGTESNIIAMYLAKSARSHINNPNVVIPKSAHYSFDKAASLMGLELRKANLNRYYQVDIDNMESMIDRNTIALVGIAGTSALGVVDSIEKISKLAQDYNAHFHVDGAFGGLVLPYLEELNIYGGCKYDFRVPGIDTYTVDPHKMGMGIIPTGALLVNTKSLNQHNFKIPYLAGGGVKSYNLLGTRPGASALSFWALLKYLGREGFRNIIHTVWKRTKNAYSLLNQFPHLESVQKPTMNILGIRPTESSPYSLLELDRILRSNGWALGKFEQERLLRMVFMPHVESSHITQFFDYLESIF